MILFARRGSVLSSLGNLFQIVAVESPQKQNVASGEKAPVEIGLSSLFACTPLFLNLPFTIAGVVSAAYTTHSGRLESFKMNHSAL